MKKLLPVLLFGCASLLAFDSARVFKPCMFCHGKQGELVAVKSSPVLASLSEDELATRLLNIKKGSTDMSPKFVKMHEVKLKYLKEENVQEFAKYIVSLKK